MNIATLLSYFNQTSDDETTITGFSTDTRSISPGNVFVALQGEHFDGHHFLQQAQEKGAILAIVHRQEPGITLPQLEVPDTLQALKTIATQYRQVLTCPVIALTGSNGKTTVKEMIAAILPKPSYATEGNLNNHIGVPLSVLRIQPECRYVVLELGANHLGEIAYTTAIVKPDVALINNIAPAHIGEFGSIEAVAKTKGEIYQGLKTAGVAVVNDDDVYAHFWDAHLKDKHVIRFSKEKPADLQARDVVLNAQGLAQFIMQWQGRDYPVTVNVPGLHMVSNALAATACCLGLGLGMDEIVKGLSAFAGVKGRLQRKQGQHGACIIDDTYNANLKSVMAAIDVLAHYPGKRYFVMGDMGELGEHAKSYHETVGLHAKALKLDGVFTTGEWTKHTALAFGDKARHFDNKTALIETLRPLLDAQTTVLVKGSRSAKMEDVVSGLTEPRA